jgi:hypothetical protein
VLAGPAAVLSGVADAAIGKFVVAVGRPVVCVRGPQVCVPRALVRLARPRSGLFGPHSGEFHLLSGGTSEQILGGELAAALRQLHSAGAQFLYPGACPGEFVVTVSHPPFILPGAVHRQVRPPGPGLPGRR